MTYIEKWDTRFVELAYLVARWSKDPVRKVGAVIVSPDRRSVSYGYNGFPRSIADTPERLADPELKLKFTVHAELNAILNAPFDIQGSTLYVTQPPCHECSKAIIQKGLKRVVCPPQRPLSKWAWSWKTGEELMLEANVEQSFISLEESTLWDKVYGS